MANDSKRRCPDCENIDANSLFDKGNGRCRECKGTGHDQHAEALVQFATLGQEGDYYPCKTCAGTGQCQSCGGTGYEYYHEVEDNRDTNEGDFSAQNRVSDRNDPEYDIIRAAVERQMANEASWIEFLFLRLPIFLFSAIARLFWKPLSNDDLYMKIVFLFITMREQAADRTAAGFDACVKDMHSWIDAKCEIDKTRLNSTQRTYVEMVRKRCELEPNKVRNIVDKLIVNRDSQNPEGILSLLKELDSVFKPVDGSEGSVVMLRAVQTL